MKITVAILNYNGASLLETFLPSVIKYSIGAEIIVIDNASTDESIEVLEKKFPEVTTILLKENLGYAGGYNEGLKSIKSDVLALVNSDIEVTENWLLPIEKAFREDQGLGMVQPKIKDYKNKDYFEYAGASGGFLDKYGFAYCRGRIFDELEVDRGQYDTIMEIDWASGACLFIRTSLFWELGGFDCTYFAHFEEIDLGWRARNANRSIKVIPQSLVYHVGGATLEASSPFKTYLNFRNSLYTLMKNLPSRVLFPRLFIRMIFDGVAGIQFLIQGKTSHFKAVIKAHFSFYKQSTSMYKKRKDQVIRKDDYYQQPSIVKDYFIDGKKNFSDLP